MKKLISLILSRSLGCTGLPRHFVPRNDEVHNRHCKGVSPWQSSTIRYKSNIKPKAFSLIELLISLIVISVITTAFAPVVTHKLKHNKLAISTSARLNCSKFDSDCFLCSETQCLICKQSFLNINGKYVNPEEGCDYKDCAEKFGEGCAECTKDYCTSCKSKFGYDSTNKSVKNLACKNCPSDQISQGGTNACKKCDTGYYVGDGYLVAGSPVGGSECKKCSTGCATCSSSYGCKGCCSTCESGYHKYGGGYSCTRDCVGSEHQKPDGTCVSCTGEEYWNGTGCATCSDGQHWNGSSCITCSDGTYWYSGSCMSCPNGTYLSSGSACIACSEGCATCSSSSYCHGCCSTCKSGYHKYSYSCIPDCPDGQYEQDNGQCVNCPLGCATCTKPGYMNDGCLTCITGYHKATYGQCNADCPEGKFQRQDGSCSDCPEHCKTCYAINDNMTALVCTSCFGTHTLKNSPATGRDYCF